MRIKYIFYIFISLCFIFSALDSAYAEPAKILVIITENQPSAAGSSAGITVNIGAQEALSMKNLETMLGGHLFKAGYQVLTSDDISSISREDITEARKGNMEKARKLAALSDANLTFSGNVKTEISSHEVYGIKMQKAVSTISYKLMDTASGAVLNINTLQYRGSDRTQEEARHSSFKNMTSEISLIIMKKTSSQLSEAGKNRLAKYKNEITSMTIAAAPVTPQPVRTWPEKYPSSVQKTQPSKVYVPRPAKQPAPAVSEPETIVVSKSIPQIIIINPPVSRSFKVVEKKKSVKIEGIVKDNSGIRFVKINGQETPADKDGNFSYTARLSKGENNFRIVAMNKAGEIASKDIIIESEEDKTPPEIVMISPRVEARERGFKAVIQASEKETLVEGIVKDDSPILYVKVNDEKVQLNEDGRFSRLITLRNQEGKIIIDASDEMGNKTVKEFTVTRGADNLVTAESPALPKGVKSSLWVLSVGVSKYGSNTVDLQYADKDALSLSDFLKKQEGKLFAEVHLKTLVNEHVTRDSIIESMSTHLNQAGPNDVIFIFIAGHGIKHAQTGSYYFMPYNADLNSVMSKGLRMSDFDESVKMLSKNVNKVIIAMDTCHSGAMEVGARAGGSGENLAEALREASGLFILSASKGGEASLEDIEYKLHKNDSGHGAFTYALINGMSGKANYDKDEYISLNELFQYVAKQVPRLTNGRQHPYFRSQGTDMPFIMLEN